jgi:NAD(P)-dependent dehydrogenase (short-subunit alcohol dehydrogenase family)
MNAIRGPRNATAGERLAGKVAVITGASTGIGASTAALFVAQGARVAIMARRSDRLASTAAAIGAPDRVLAVAGDVGRPADVDRLIGQTLDRFGTIDILVSNAGIHRVTPFVEIADDDWTEMLGTNLTGTFLVCRRVAREMVEADRGGSIVLTASTNGFVAEPGMAPYNATKAALIMLARSMAIDLAPYRIRANAVAPGTILSEITRPMVEAGFPFGEIPLARIGQPEEVAAAILFLASDESSYVTGGVLVVDGGQTALNGGVAGKLGDD